MLKRNNCSVAHKTTCPAEINARLTPKAAFCGQNLWLPMGIVPEMCFVFGSDRLTWSNWVERMWLQYGDESASARHSPLRCNIHRELLCYLRWDGWTAESLLMKLLLLREDLTEGGASFPAWSFSRSRLLELTVHLVQWSWIANLTNEIMDRSNGCNLYVHEG